uniref:Uncharacterized protein n=1 Tax=Anguilla anguilla TaxID=7936 RepID=A0A0E9RSX0_ANGAN
MINAQINFLKYLQFNSFGLFYNILFYFCYFIQPL